MPSVQSKAARIVLLHSSLGDSVQDIKWVSIEPLAVNDGVIVIYSVLRAISQAIPWLFFLQRLRFPDGLR